MPSGQQSAAAISSNVAPAKKRSSTTRRCSSGKLATARAGSATAKPTAALEAMAPEVITRAATIGPDRRRASRLRERPAAPSHRLARPRTWPGTSRRRVLRAPVRMEAEAPHTPPLRTVAGIPAAGIPVVATPAAGIRAGIRSSQPRSQTTGLRKPSSSSRVRGQSSRRRRLNPRSASSFPPVWQIGQ